MTKKLLITLSILTLFASCGTRGGNATISDCIDGVVINGVRWATRNVDAPGTFAETPESLGMLFQWNRKKAWNTVDEKVEGWNNTPDLGTAWYAENDPCPQGWRVPTKEDFSALFHGTFDYVVDDWTTWILRNLGNLWEDYDFSQNWTYNWQDTGASGMVFGRAPNQIFLPITPTRDGYDGFLFALEECEEYEAEYWGFYWLATHNDEDEEVHNDRVWRSRIDITHAWSLTFSRGVFVTMGSNLRTHGFPIRCVAIN